MIDEDRTDAELEALLRATFTSEAHRQVPDGRAVPSFPAAAPVATVHPMRRRWVGLSVVAAALVAVVVGATVLANETMQSERRPTPAGTSVAPAPTVTASRPTTRPPSPTARPTAATSTAPATSPSAPPPAPTKQVMVLGVGLTVPSAWNIVTRPVGETGTTPSVCFTTDTAIRSTGSATYDCQLSVSVGAALWGSTDVDRVGFAPDGGLCGTDHRVPHETDTVVADELVVDGQTVEHRGFTGSCLDQTLDQWSVPTAPFVQFWRDFGPADPVGRAQALTAVQSARLPGPRSPLRLMDRGYITAVSGDTMSLDRITDLNQLGVQDVNPATYPYPVGNIPPVRYDDPVTQQHLVFAPADMVGLLQGPQVIAGVRVPALSSLQAFITTNGTQVTGIDLTARG